METLEDDINQLLSDVGLGEYRNLFTHTHKQKGTGVHIETLH